jgi:hypothetical protein
MRHRWTSLLLLALTTIAFAADPLMVGSIEGGIAPNPVTCGWAKIDDARTVIELTLFSQELTPERLEKWRAGRFVDGRLAQADIELKRPLHKDASRAEIDRIMINFFMKTGEHRRTTLSVGASRMEASIEKLVTAFGWDEDTGTIRLETAGTHTMTITGSTFTVTWHIAGDAKLEQQKQTSK